MTDLKTKPLKPDPIVALKELVEGMDAEQRTRLEQAGIVVPAGDIGQLRTGKYTWGMRCTACNKIALFFVGDEWTGPDGSKYDEPPSVPQNRILWTQDLPPDQIDRNQPRCQHCNVLLPMNTDGSFMRTRQRIQRVAEWEKSRDASRDKKFVRDTAKKLTQETGQYMAEVSTSYDKAEAAGPVSKVIERQLAQSGIGLADLEKFADETGATDALKKGFK